MYFNLVRNTIYSETFYEVGYTVTFMQVILNRVKLLRKYTKCSKSV